MIRVINGITGEVVFEFEDYGEFDRYMSDCGLDIDYYTEEIK